MLGSSRIDPVVSRAVLASMLVSTDHAVGPNVDFYPAWMDRRLDTGSGRAVGGATPDGRLVHVPCRAVPVLRLPLAVRVDSRYSTLVARTRLDRVWWWWLVVVVDLVEHAE